MSIWQKIVDIYTYIDEWFDPTLRAMNNGTYDYNNKIEIDVDDDTTFLDEIKNTKSWVDK